MEIDPLDLDDVFSPPEREKCDGRYPTPPPCEAPEQCPNYERCMAANLACEAFAEYANLDPVKSERARPNKTIFRRVFGDILQRSDAGTRRRGPAKKKGASV